MQAGGEGFFCGVRVVGVFYRLCAPCPSVLAAFFVGVRSGGGGGVVVEQHHSVWLQGLVFFLPVRPLRVGQQLVLPMMCSVSLRSILGLLPSSFMQPALVIANPRPAVRLQAIARRGRCFAMLTASERETSNNVESRNISILASLQSSVKPSLHTDSR